MAEYHIVVSEIINVLEKKHCWFETFEHEEVRTSEEAARTRPGYTLAQGAKAIVVRVRQSGKETAFVMLVLPGDLRFDSAKVKKQLDAKDLRFATSEEVEKLTGGVLPGGVPPFGNLFGLQVLADTTLFSHEKIVFNAGDRRFSVAMKSQDYRSIVQPLVADISSE